MNKFGNNCYDIDECGLGTHDCPKESMCVNDIGNYTCDCFYDYTDDNCQCRDGFDQHVTGTCTDIDECSRGIHKCQKNLECINNSGDYVCKPFCEEGFENTYDENCRDIDECALRTHNCSSVQQCINIDGDFSCKE